MVIDGWKIRIDGESPASRIAFYCTRESDGTVLGPFFDRASARLCCLTDGASAGVGTGAGIAAAYERGMRAGMAIAARTDASEC
jgi:hypothetical protein